jgi:DNA-binding transcriptional LysR family regulator
MELRRLRYFLRIAAEGSLGKASRALGVAQPALGRHVQMLEEELGVKLFRRVPKGMQLTDEGEYLKEALEHPIDLVHKALHNVRSFATRVEASLVLGLPPEIAPILGARLVQRLQADLPYLSLRVVESDSASLAADLARGLVDIALLVNIVPSEKVFHFEVVREPLMLVAQTGTSIAARDSVAFGELRRLPLILPGMQTGLRTKLEKACLTADTELNVVLEIDSIELTKRAVRGGLGHAVLPPVAFRAEAERGELAGVRIVDPQIDQVTRCAIRPRWPVPRNTYDAVEAAIFHEWFAAVHDGEWPAEWLFDMTQLGMATAQPASLRSARGPMLN